MSVNLGVLYAKITADTSGLKKGLSEMKSFGKVGVGAVGVIAKAATGAVAAISSVGGAASLLVNSVAKDVKQLENLAGLAGLDVGSLQAYAFATESVGVNAEKLADISKDVFDKVGDYAATGGGEMADFFENIGNKAGLTADALLKMSGPEALGAMKAAMDEAGLSAKEQIFYLEGIANDASLLAPLLADNSKELKRLADRGRELGVALNEIEVQNLKDAAKASKEFGATFDVLKNKIAAGFAPVFTTFMNFAVEQMQLFNKSFSSDDITRWAKESSIAILEFTQFVVDGFGSVYGVLQNINGTVKLSFAGFMKLVQGIQFLFEQSNRFFGDTEKAEYWAKAQQQSAKMAEDAVISASESFDKADRGSEVFSQASKKIEELQNQIRAIETRDAANDIQEKMIDPLDALAKKTTPLLYKNFEGVWVNGGKAAEENLGSINGQLDSANKTLSEMRDKAEELSKMEIRINTSGTEFRAPGRKFGGPIGMKIGGAVSWARAQAGRYFPGYGGGDKIRILGEAGEFMLRKEAVREGSQEAARAFNNGDWPKLMEIIGQKLRLGGPVASPWPSLALASGGSVGSLPDNSQSARIETPRNYYVGNDPEPIRIKADERNAQRLMSALERRNRRRI